MRIKVIKAALYDFKGELQLKFFFFWFFLIFFVLKILLESDIPVFLLLYEMVLHCNNEPENLVNNVWIAEFYRGYEHRLHRGSNSTMNNNLR